MALLEESLVEEYYRREGYFTIRGLKCGSQNKEIDLLCIKPMECSLECIHVEVHVSYKPVGYISKVSKLLQKKFNCSGGAIFRPDELLYECVMEWVSSKFSNDTKKKVRESLVPKTQWKFVFVCANVKDDRELQMIEKRGIEIKRWESIVQNLLKPSKGTNTVFLSDITDLLYHSKKEPFIIIK